LSSQLHANCGSNTNPDYFDLNRTGRKILTAATLATMGKYKWWFKSGGIEVETGVTGGDEKKGVGEGAL
jgi:hypothetical protein